MDHRQFLDVLAASMPGKPSPARTSALRQFAPKLAIDIPASHLSRELVDAVAPMLTEFPGYDGLLRAIRAAPIVHAEPAGRSGGHAMEGEAGAWCSTFAKRVADGADMAKLLTIACRHYRAEAWEAIRTEYREDVRRLVPHLDPEPVPPEERARRYAAFRAQTLFAAAPPPAGPLVTTRPIADAPPARSSGHLEGDALAAARAAAIRRSLGDAA